MEPVVSILHFVSWETGEKGRAREREGGMRVLCRQLFFAQNGLHLAYDALCFPLEVLAEKVV